MDSLEETRNEELLEDVKENKSNINNLLNRTVQELKKSEARADKILDGESEDVEAMLEAKQAILSKICYLETFTVSEDYSGVENNVDYDTEKEEENRGRRRKTGKRESETEWGNEKEKRQKYEIENEDAVYVDIEILTKKKETEKKELTFFEDFEKNKSNFQMAYLKKKEVVGYTVSGDAIIINNKNFLQCINSCFSKKKQESQNFFDIGDLSSMKEKDKRDKEEEKYFSEESCTSSSIISLHSFVRQQNKLRIQNNREQYVKHKYFEDSYMNHILEDCSDCSERSIEWFNNKTDNVFYYSNLLKEDKRIAHKSAFEMPKKGPRKKKCHKYISPFYKYIYFKRSKENGAYFPVFVNKRNGKKRLCSLKIKRKHTYDNDILENHEQRKRDKWELDPSLFSYKSLKLLNSAEEQKNSEETEVTAIESTELLSEYKREVLEIERTAENLLNETKRLGEMKRQSLENTEHAGHYDKVIQKYRDVIEKKSNFRFRPLCHVEKINLKVKILGSDGTVIKHKRLERLSIDKSQTFGYLMKKLGKCFQLSDQDIENIKIFFDGDICDKDATFDDETIGLQDDFQLDVRFPQTKEKLLEIKNLLFDQCYPIIHPDFYQID